MNSFNSHFLASLLVSRQFDKTKLALPKVILKSVKVKQVCITYHLVKPLKPLLLHLLPFKVKDS